MLNLHLFVIPPWIHYLFNCGLVLVAFRWGGWRERLLASTLLGSNVVGHVICVAWACWAGAHPWGAWKAAAMDMTVLAACLAGLRRAESYWIIWAGAFSLLSVSTNLIAAMVPGLVGWPSGTAGIIWFYLTAVAILWGVFSGDPARSQRISTSIAA